MSPVFADTFYFVAFLNPLDAHHQRVSVERTTQAPGRDDFVGVDGSGGHHTPNFLRPSFVSRLELHPGSQFCSTTTLRTPGTFIKRSRTGMESVGCNKADGRQLWKTSRLTTATKTFSFTTPLVITVAGRKQIVTPGSGVVSALDPKTGAEIWRVRYGEGFSVIPRPVFGHGMIFISTGFDHPSVLAIRVDGRGDVTDTHVVWKLSRSAPNTPSLLVVGDELYMVSDAGIASCVDARTGQVHWQERVASDCSASPIFADGKIYIQDEHGLGVVLKPGRKFEKLATNKLDERTLASYCVADGALFIRGEEHLYCIRK